jgi:hypothetical protein
MKTTKAILLSAALLLAAVSQASAQKVFHGPGHGPPDTMPKAPRVCVAANVTCSSTIYAIVGERCSCMTPSGRRLSGTVHWKNWR